MCRSILTRTDGAHMQLVADVHAQWQEYRLVHDEHADLRHAQRLAPQGLQQVAGSGVPVSVRAPVDGSSRLPAV